MGQTSQGRATAPARTSPLPVRPPVGVPADTGLRPGQRWPTDEERAEALADTDRPSLFPLGEVWEITERRAQAWFNHNFAGRRGDTNRFRILGDLSDDEFALLLWDLDCYRGLGRRGVEQPPLHEYLQPGREHWGEIAVLIRELAESEWDEDE